MKYNIILVMAPRMWSCRDFTWSWSLRLQPEPTEGARCYLGAQQAPAGIISSHQLTAQYTVTYIQLTPRSHTAVWPFSDSVR